jgi:hypothetical protein
VRWRYGLRGHAVERAAEILGLVSARRDEQVVARKVHAEKLTLEEVDMTPRDGVDRVRAHHQALQMNW